MNEKTVKDFRNEMTYCQRKLLKVLIKEFVLNSNANKLNSYSQKILVNDICKIYNITKKKQVDKALKDIMLKTYINNYDHIHMFNKISNNGDIVSFHWNNEVTGYLSDLNKGIFKDYLDKAYLYLKSKKAKNLYLYLNEYKHNKVINSIYNIKEITNCTTKTFRENYRFNDLVLKKIVREINELTDIDISYTLIKENKTIKTIEFIVNDIRGRNYNG